MSVFKKATKFQSFLKMGLIGPAGAGKTYTALTVGKTLVENTGKRIAVIDTEHGSSSKYSDIFDFDMVELEDFNPQNYIDVIQAAEKEGFGVLIIDSLSHAWSGKGGALEMVEKAKQRSPSHNSFAAWRDVTPLHNRLIDSIVSARIHIIVTFRSKTEYVIEQDDRGKQQVRKVGLAPVFRDGAEYEFDVVADMDQENTLVVTKSRCPTISNEVIKKPGKELGETLLTWLSGAPKPEVPQDYSETLDTDKPCPKCDGPMEIVQGIFKGKPFKGERCTSKGCGFKRQLELS